MIRAHQPGSEPIDIPETIPNPIVVPKPHLLRQNPLPRSQFGSRRGCPAQHELPAARDGAGNPIEVVRAWSDVTARKQLAEALAAAQERLRQQRAAADHRALLHRTGPQCRRSKPSGMMVCTGPLPNERVPITVARR